MYSHSYSQAEKSSIHELEQRIGYIFNSLAGIQQMLQECSQMLIAAQRIQTAISYCKK